MKYKVLVQLIRARLGNINIVLFGIPPRPKDHVTLGARAIEFNKVIKSISTELGVAHHPLYQAFLSHGQPKPWLFHADKLHLSDAGVIILAKAVKMYRAMFLVRNT